MSVDHPFIAVLIRKCFNQSWVTSRNFWFGHGETRTRRAFAQRTQILLFLFWSCPVQQCVLVTLVWRLGIQHEWSNADFGRFSRHGRHSGWTKTHSTPFGRHMRQPQFPIFTRDFAQFYNCLHYLRTIMLICCIPLWSHHGVHEFTNLHPNFLDFWREGKINHVASLPDNKPLPRVGFWS